MITPKFDSRGTLIPIYQKDFGKEFKRIMIFKDVPKGGLRGNHGHRREKQLLFVLSGKIEVDTESFSERKKIILYENEHIILEPLTWNIFKFLEGNSSMIVFGSEDYDEDEYIREYQEFVQMKSQ
jgi:dTDP-4-dehydrorhamnose 3,5-epimerase-like enzyme